MSSKIRTVYKYELRLGDYVTVPLPKGAEIIYVAVQADCPYLWARVDPDPQVPVESRRFRIAGTGHRLGTDVGRHIGSFMLQDGALVFHVFEA